MTEQLSVNIGDAQDRTLPLRAGRIAPLQDLDRIRVLTDVEDEQGRIVPAGSVGTVVVSWAGGRAFEIDFTDPVEATASVERDVIEPVGRRVD